MLEKIFKLQDRSASVKSEVGAGISAFMVTAYIIFVNPIILQEIGLPIEATITATCIVVGICTIFMGVYTNYPFVLASSMELSMLLVSVCWNKNINWQTGMAIIFIEGIIITLIVLTKLREWLMNTIPYSLKAAIRTGTGILLAFIGLKNAGIVVNDPVTFVKHGTFTLTPTIVASLGLIIIVFLLIMGIKGGFLLGIILTWLINLSFGVPQYPTKLIDIPSLNTFGSFIYGFPKVMSIGLWGTIFIFLLYDFFESIGNIITVGSQARLLEIGKTIPHLNRILFVDSIGTVLGGIFSCGPITTSIEGSSMAVTQGGKTGLSSVITGFLFLLIIPILRIIGKGYEPTINTLYPVTAPVLIIIGFILAKGAIYNIPWDKLDEALPAFMTIIITPLSLSIPHGIGWGFISYTLIKLFSGRLDDLHPLIIIISILFAISFSPIIPK